MYRDSVPGLEAYAPALGLLAWGDLFGDVFSALVDLDAVEPGPIAGDPGGTKRLKKNRDKCLDVQLDVLGWDAVVDVKPFGNLAGCEL